MWLNRGDLDERTDSDQWIPRTEQHPPCYHDPGLWAGPNPETACGSLSNAMADLKEHKSRIKQVYQENELVSQRLKAASIAMSAYAAELTEWDQSVVYQLVEKVTVLAKDKIRVTFRNGTEVEQEIEQLDWRNAS